MKNTFPILLVDDDDDYLMQMVFNELEVENKLIHFQNEHALLCYLNITISPTFLIFSDFKMPGSNAIGLKEMIKLTSHIPNHNIPVIFFSEFVTKKQLEIIHKTTSQGFFEKSNTFSEMKNCMKTILTYWDSCSSTN